MKPSNHTAPFVDIKYFIQLFCLLLFSLGTAAQRIDLTRVPLPNTFSDLGRGTEDPQGYMWFASENGVHRYDGYHYVTWINDPLDSNSLANNIVATIYAGKDGIIWIGTESVGLDRFDPETGKFTHFRYDPYNDSTLNGNKISAILEDKSGMMWIGTQSGLNMLDPKTYKITRYQHHPGDSTSLSNNYVRVLYEDRKGTIWVGTGNSFSENPEGGLNRFIPQNRTFKQYLHDPDNQNSLIDNRVCSILEDSRGVFWIGTSGDGLHTMNRDKGDFHRHTYDPIDPGKLSRPPLKKALIWAKWVIDHITFIKEDAAGYIWIGTLCNGLNRYDYKTNKVLFVPDVHNDDLTTRRTNAWWAHSSKDGIFWVGYWNGAFRYDPLRKNIPFIETGTSVVSIYRDSSMLLYGGLGTGLIKKDLSGQTEKHFIHDPSDPNSINDNNVQTIYKDPHGTFWVGTDKGLNTFDPQRGFFSRYKLSSENQKEINDFNVYSILEDKNENKWFSTVSHGLIKMDSHSGMLYHYASKPGDSNSINGGRIKCVYEDRDSNLWIGYYLDGINKLYTASGKVERYLSKTDVNNITQDASGIIWVGTKNGLYRSNAEQNRFSLYRDAYKEIPGNINFGSILEDNYKTLWLSTSIGVLKINPKRDRLLVWAEKAQAKTYGFKTKDGQLYFGSKNGYFAFYPDELKSNPNPPQIVINEFRIADIPAPINTKTGIRLRHDQNTFSFQFAGIHYNNPAHNRHLYMLENLDNTWRKGGEERTAYYNNVPPGRYFFHVKASNSDGLWSEIIIPVIVNPPWWRTWWAYTLYAIAAATLIWLFIYSRIKNLRNQLKQKQKEFQFEELRRQKIEIEMQALRAQMNPHFIFNSLNSINGFILDNNKNDASAYLSKFSRLVRLILLNSQASSIPLQSELEALQLYLELEALRFGNHFNFKINIADEVDPGSLKVPPLIIQPFAENAIWHGLMPRKTIGNLEIDVFLDDQILVCRIRDDGIGRKKAAELKSKSRIGHKSFGMKITASRIDLLKEKEVLNSSVVINDLVLPDNSAAGTEVIIKLPVKYE
jgi:ligand-binding sensor domain-containing protein